MNSSDLAEKIVLVIDDEPQILYLIVRLLEPFNCQVLTAPNAHEAYALYDKYRDNVGLIMTDIMMPNINGLDLIETLRLHDSRVPILVISGDATRVRQTDGIDELNINGWLSKPFTIIDFEQSINNLFIK